MSSSEQCEIILKNECGGKAYLMPSCTAALELICMMILEPGDEVIMPSWAFPSCANAVILRGAVPVFVDVDENLNLSAVHVANAITDRTKAVMIIHYGGVVTELSQFKSFCEECGIYLIEDAAQAIGNWHIQGDFGALSFHYTKNIECGQGGALILKDDRFVEKAEMMMHCGTDKLKMYRGQQSSYNWLDVGSQYIMSEYQAEVLEKNLMNLDKITQERRHIWQIYRDACTAQRCALHFGNGHFFWWFADKKWERLVQFRKYEIPVSSHFEALHNTPPGIKYGRSMPCPESLLAEKMLLKINTNVSEKDARIFAETIWQSSIDAGASIH